MQPFAGFGFKVEKCRAFCAVRPVECGLALVLDGVPKGPAPFGNERLAVGYLAF